MAPASHMFVLGKLLDPRTRDIKLQHFAVDSCQWSWLEGEASLYDCDGARQQSDSSSSSVGNAGTRSGLDYFLGGPNGNGPLTVHDEVHAYRTTTIAPGADPCPMPYVRRSLV